MVDDVARTLRDAASREMSESWNAERASRLERGVARRVQVRARRRAVSVAGAAMLLVCGLAGVAVRALVPHTTRPTQARGGTLRNELRLPDGSRAVPLDDRSEVRPLELTGDRATLQLVRGAARFEVVHTPSRVFRVEAGPVVFQVLGTVFVVARDEHGVTVSVESGRVRVFEGANVADLGKGEHAAFAADMAQVAAAPPGVPMANVAPTAELPTETGESTPPPRALARGPSWRGLAESGDFTSAYAALHRATGDGVRSDPVDLMRAADAARFSGHAEEAMGYLRRVVRDHGQDPRAPLAAFTLGRVLLTDQGRPAEAAEAFAQAQTLAPGSSLGEDALAHEVEALARAGDVGAAHARAQEYRERYPTGRWRQRVDAFGGGDE